MDNKIQDTLKSEKKLIGNKFVNWGIFLIILGPIVGVLSFFIYSAFVGRLISNDGDVDALIILGGISTVGVGVSLVILGCVKNIIQKFIND